MPVYKYRAKRDDGITVEDRIEARSEKEAIEQLSLKGYLPFRMEEVRDGEQPAGSIIAKPLGRINPRQITVFSRQLASLLKSGVPILNSLSIISEQSEDPRLQTILDNVHKSVREGSTFSSALERYPRAFPPLYIALVRSGESSGGLPEALLRISDYRTKQEEVWSRFRMALAYPMLMAIVGLGTVVFMLTFVVPRLMKIFINMGGNLPMPTRILIAVSAGLRQWGVWIIVGMGLIIIIAKRQLKSEPVRLSFSLFKLHLPVFGKFILKAELSRFCRTLEMLIKNGIPILKALDTAIPVLDNEVIKKHLLQSCKDLEQGGSLGRSLKNSKIFPKFMTNLIIVGEESGKLQESLGEVASSYEFDTEESIRIMNNLIEPVMILVMGLIVGFIVIAMLLPIFEINVMAR
jgi:general secretion pathway protein F